MSGAYNREEHIKGTPLKVCTSLTRKYYSRLLRLARGKPSSLFVLISAEEKEILYLTYKLFSLPH
jgi:hypothetical protein